MSTTALQRLTGYAAMAAGVCALLYAYTFVVAKDVMLSSLFLLLLGLLSLKVMVILYGWLRKINEDLARLVVVLGAIGSTGMALHGGYDLANAINPPAMPNLDLPNQVDPRGLVAFGFMGAAILKASFLFSKDSRFPNGLVWTGYLSGALLVLIYVARLTVLSPTHPLLLYPVLLNGFIIGPLWYVWLGYVLLKKSYVKQA